MPRKEKESLQDMLKGLRDSLNAQANQAASVGSRIPHIMEFVESKDYLGLPHLDTPIHLFPMQRLILKCVAGDNYVTDGETGERVTVERFCREQRKSVLSFDEEDRKYVSQQVTWSGKSGTKKIYRLSLASSGLSVRLTSDHRVLTHAGYKRVEELGKDDIVYVPHTLPAGDGKDGLSEHEVKLLAYFIGDGSCSKRPHFVSANSEPVVLADFIECVRRFDETLQCKPEARRGCQMIKVVKGGSDARNPHVENSLWVWLQSHAVAGHVAHTKRIPNVVYRFDRHKLAIFVRHLFSTDGHASVLGNSSAVIGYTTCNLSLAEDVCHILRRLGVRSKVFSGTTKYTYKGITRLRPFHQVRVYRTNEIIKFQKNVGTIFGKEAASEAVFVFAANRLQAGVSEDRLPCDDNAALRNLIKSEAAMHDERPAVLTRLRKFVRLNAGHVEECASVIDNPFIDDLRGRDVAYDTVGEIVAEGEEVVYDLSVEGFHNFVCNDIVVHNCFYRGSPGNTGPESDFTPEEIQLLKDSGLDSDDRGNVLAKLDNGVVFRELVLVCGRRCLSEDTLMTCPASGAVRTLGHMWDYGETEDLMSWTLDERTGQMVVMPSCNLIHQGVREVFKVETASGHEIEATANHPLLTERGWVHVSDLKIGEDKIAAVTSEPFFGDSSAISEHEAALLGYITGDGCCSQVSTFFTCANDEVRKDFERCLHLLDPNLELFQDPWTGAKSKLYQYKVRQKEQGYEDYYNESRGCWTKKRKKNTLRKLLERHGLMGKTCHHKVVPPALYECPRNVVAAYLRALFSCDGSFSTKRSRRHQVTVEFTSVNRKQTEAVSALLRRFGIFAGIRKRVQATEIKREGKKYRSTSYTLHFTKKEYIRRFVRNFGMCFKQNGAEVERVMQQWPSEGEVVGATEFTLVKSVAGTGKKRTFDLQVSHSRSLQNFTAQGFISHNSGKDFISSIIALYEAMKLLETPGGDPYAVYNLPRGGNPITILTIATSASQAGIAFAEMKAKMLHSKYFKTKFISEGLTNSQIFLQTPVDAKEHAEAQAKGLPPVKGSIVIRAGHSNSDSLLGIQCFVLLLDEVASFKATEGSSGGRRIYEAMLPSLNTFIRNRTDKDGNVVYGLDGKPDKVFDSKVVSLSSPRGKEGILYEQFQTAPSKDDRLAFRLPTWVVNTKYPRDKLRDSFRQFNDDRFMMEFGADFSSTAGTAFFDEDRVRACFFPTMKFVDYGTPGIVYFAHLDPATNSNNYALAICHKEMRINPETRRADAFVVLDHLKFWVPSKEHPIIIDEIDGYILDMNRRFHLGLVTYDAFNSASSIQKLRRAGIPCKMTPYNQKYKNQIFSQLELLVNEKRLLLPKPGWVEDDNLENELINLQRRWATGSRGYSVFANKECETPTDDCCDALAGAAFNCLATTMNRLPQSKLVSMPSTQRGATRSPLGMQGMPYSQRVLDHLRSRNGLSGGSGFTPPPRPGY